MVFFEPYGVSQHQLPCADVPIDFKGIRHKLSNGFQKRGGEILPLASAAHSRAVLLLTSTSPKRPTFTELYKACMKTLVMRIKSGLLVYFDVEVREGSSNRTDLVEFGLLLSIHLWNTTAYHIFCDQVYTFI